jgi:hypothetical protein
VAVDEEIGGGPYTSWNPCTATEAQWSAGDSLPHDPARDRDELEVDVGDALVDDLPLDLLDEVVTAVLSGEALQRGGHQGSLLAVNQ